MDFLYLYQNEDFAIPEVQEFLTQGTAWDFGPLQEVDVLDNFFEGSLCQIDGKPIALFLIVEDDGDGSFQCILQPDLDWLKDGKAVLDAFAQEVWWHSISSFVHKDDYKRQQAFIKSNFSASETEGEFICFSYIFDEPPQDE